MKSLAHIFVLGCSVVLAGSVVAQGVSFEELAEHIAKTNPAYQSIELQPKLAELRYNAAVAEDWYFSADSGFDQNHRDGTYDNGTDWRNESKYWNNRVDLDRYSQTTGISYGLGYSYYRNTDRYRYSSDPGVRSASYDSRLSVSAYAPLWNNAFGYMSRRYLQQSEIGLQTARLAYLSNRQAFMARTQQQFTTLCFFIAAEALTTAAHQRALALAHATKKQGGAEDGRSDPRTERFGHELAGSLKSTQRARATLLSDFVTEYEFPRLKTEMPLCNLEQRFSYASSDAEIETLIGETRTIQNLKFTDRVLELEKEIVYDGAKPRVNISASYTLSGNDVDEWNKSLDKDGRGYRINLNLNYPIGSRARMQMDQIDLERIQFENTKRETSLRILADFRRLVLDLQDIEKEIELQQQQVESARAAREQDARLVAGNGRLDVALYEDSVRKELDAEITLLMSQRDYQFAYLNYQLTASNGAAVPFPPSPRSLPRSLNARIIRR